MRKVQAHDRPVPRHDRKVAQLAGDRRMNRVGAHRRRIVHGQHLVSPGKRITHSRRSGRSDREIGGATALARFTALR